MSEFKVGDKVLVEAEIVHIDDGEWFPYCLECGGKNFSTDRIWPIPTKTYEDGLREAWELAKKIVFYEKRGGFSTSQLEEIFGTSDFDDIIDNHTPQEAAAKIAERESRQDIHVGDLVRVGFGYGVVTSVHKENCYVCGLMVHLDAEIKNTSPKPAAPSTSRGCWRRLEGRNDVTVMQDGIEVFVLPDGARCVAGVKEQNPLDIDECPYGHDICDGDCMYYSEERVEARDETD